MPRRVLALNVLLVVTSLVFAGSIVRQLAMPSKRPAPARAKPAPSVDPTATPAVEPARPGAGAYSVVAARNLFSPTRTEAPAVTGSALGPIGSLPRPLLHGVVVREGASIAYLEDPTTKRVAGYRVGDTIAGGTVQTIAGDRVEITRPDGNVDVRLRDPSRPRPVAPAAGQGGIGPGPAFAPPLPPPVIPPPGVIGTTPVPGTVPPSGPAALPPPQPGAGQFQPGRRPLPPNLMRRLPPGTTRETPQQ